MGAVCKLSPLSLQINMQMSLKKKDKSTKKTLLSPPTGGAQATAGAMPEEARRKLRELFGQIEQHVEQLYAENATRE